MHCISDAGSPSEFKLNVEKALNIIENATEIQDGLIVIIGQGVRVLDCAHYSQDHDNEVFEVRTYIIKEEKSDQQGMLNFGEMKQGYDFEDYNHTMTNYFPTSKAMHNFIASESSLYNHF